MAGCRKNEQPDTKKGIIAVLVLEHAVQNDELLSASVRVGGKVAVWRVADDRRRSRYFIDDAVEHAAIDARHGRGHPGETRRVDDGALREVCVELHCGCSDRTRPQG